MIPDSPMHETDPMPTPSEADGAETVVEPDVADDEHDSSQLGRQNACRTPLPRWHIT